MQWLRWRSLSQLTSFDKIPSMSLIEVGNVTKVFKVYDRKEGVWGGIQNLFARNYRQLKAVDGISFTIGSGEMVGYIGANGAGKSTTIKMLTGILVPTSGVILANGFVPFKDRSQYTRTIGVVFGQRTQLWWDIAVIESFQLLKKIYAIPEKDYQSRLGLFDKVLDLKPLLHTPVRKLSLGQRMRCDLAAALLHNPKIVFLDEPTIGLDVVAKENIRQFLRRINQELQVTVLLTTHDMSDIEELCRRVIIIDHGKILFDGRLDELRGRLACNSQLLLELRDPMSVRDDPIDFPQGVEFQKLDEMHYQFIFDKRLVASAELVRALVNRLPVKDLSLEDTTIEEIVREIYSRGGLD
jgi:ABC-2 type transport system ATP-binding protein